VFLGFKFRGHLDLCTFRILIPWYYISWHIGDKVSFKFGGVDKHIVCSSVCFICCFVCIYLFLVVYNFFFIALLLIRHNLHCNCGLYVISVFNLFEHCISLEIPIFYSCVGLKRLHLFDSFFTCSVSYSHQLLLVLTRV
jgi:hypothetical protein